MAVQIPRRLISIDEYERMIVAGVFPEDDRSELIRGEITEMAPIGLLHASCVSRLTKLLERRVGDAAIIWAQNPIRLVGNSLPQPDVALLKPSSDFYSRTRPAPKDVILLIEVSDTTLNYDTQVKVPLYAEAGIPEVWIVNLQNDVIEAFSSPMAGVYNHAVKVARGQSLPLPGELGGVVEVSDILG
ncbi:MAG: Uma2 family endonuclease [Chloroflexia bacterium]